MKSILKFISVFIIFVIFFSCINEKSNTKEAYLSGLKGKYLGQLPPENTPKVFAPNIISTAMYTRDMAISPDGKEIFFCVSAFGYNLIFQTKEISGNWTEPAPAPFIEDLQYMYYEPHITPDGKRLLFLSNMPNTPGQEASEDIWAVDKTVNGWGKVYNLGAPVNTDGNEFFPSSTKKGTLYFTRAEKNSRIHYIYRSQFIDGKYTEPQKLGSEVNCGTNRFNAFIDPDEKFIIVPAVGMKDSYGGTDYYIVFRDENDIWSEPINLGAKINTKDGREYSPYLSPDGKYFFFMAARTNENLISDQGNLSFANMVKAYKNPQNGNSDIYWIKADFISQLAKEIKSTK